MTIDMDIVDFDTNARICWSYRIVPTPLQRFVLSTRRCMEVRAFNMHVECRHFDVNTGPLAGLVGVMYRQPIENGFHAMTKDLKARLE